MSSLRTQYHRRIEKAKPMKFNVQGVLDTHKEMAQRHIRYSFGAKINPLTMAPENIPMSKGLDCSGYTLYQKTQNAEAGVGYPDGSVQQHEWLEAKIGNAQQPSAGHSQDGTLWQFILPPMGKEPGHTGFIFNGMTYECDGENGIDNRDWGSEHWMSETVLYRIGQAE